MPVKVSEESIIESRESISHKITYLG